MCKHHEDPPDPVAPFSTSSMVSGSGAWARESTPVTPPVLNARYGGTCSGCGAYIGVGDLIQSDEDDGWLCEGCMYQ